MVFTHRSRLFHRWSPMPPGPHRPKQGRARVRVDHARAAACERSATTTGRSSTIRFQSSLTVSIRTRCATTSVEGRLSRGVQPRSSHPSGVQRNEMASGGARPRCPGTSEGLASRTTPDPQPPEPPRRAVHRTRICAQPHSSSRTHRTASPLRRRGRRHRAHHRRRRRVGLRRRCRRRPNVRALRSRRAVEAVSSTGAACNCSHLAPRYVVSPAASVPCPRVCRLENGWSMVRPRCGGSRGRWNWRICPASVDSGR
jgi:hypothetical protein